MCGKACSAQCWELDKRGLLEAVRAAGYEAAAPSEHEELQLQSLNALRKLAKGSNIQTTGTKRELVGRIRNFKAGEEVSSVFSGAVPGGRTSTADLRTEVEGKLDSPRQRASFIDSIRFVRPRSGVVQGRFRLHSASPMPSRKEVTQGGLGAGVPSSSTGGYGGQQSLVAAQGASSDDRQAAPQVKPEIADDDNDDDIMVVDSECGLLTTPKKVYEHLRNLDLGHAKDEDRSRSLITKLLSPSPATHAADDEDEEYEEGEEGEEEEKKVVSEPENVPGA